MSHAGGSQGASAFPQNTPVAAHGLTRVAATTSDPAGIVRLIQPERMRSATHCWNWNLARGALNRLQRQPERCPRDDGGGASGNGPGGAGAKSNRRSRPHWVKLVSYRGMGADLANNAAMKPVLPLLAANPEISAAEVFKRTNVRVTDVELRDAAETLVHAATTFADLNAAGLQSVLAEHMKQTVDGASLADDAELAPSSSTAPLSSSIPFAGNEPEEEEGAAMLRMAGVLILGGSSCRSKKSPPLLFVLLMMMLLQCTASVAASAVGFQMAETLTGHSDEVYAVSFSHDSSLLASGSKDETVIITDVATWKPVATLAGHSDKVYAVSFSHDSSLLASGSRDSTVIITDTATWKPVATLTGHSAGVYAVSFSHDSSLLASASSDKAVIITDTATWKPVATLTDSNTVYAVSFSHDSSLLASGSWDKTVITDTATWKPVATLTDHTSGVSAVSFSHDSSLLASGSWDKTVIITDVATWKPVATLTGHSNWVVAVSFSHDSSLLASAGSSDNTVIITDTFTWKPVATLTDHTDYVRAVSFSPDSSLLASGSDDKTTIIYNVLQPECNGLPDPTECQTTYKDKCSSANLGNLARKQCPAMAAATTTPNAEPSTVCGAPDAERGTNTCNGNLYDFSQIQPSNGKAYFSGPDANNEHMLYFQMTGGGLPSDDSSMPYCTFGSGTNTGNAFGQGEIAGDSCFPIGLVAQQSWEIDTTKPPQVIRVTFSGGQAGRQTVLSVTCDPAADDPTFAVKGETRTLVYEVGITSKFACEPPASTATVPTTTATTAMSTTTTTMILPVNADCDPRNDHCSRSDDLYCDYASYKCRYGTTTSPPAYIYGAVGGGAALLLLLGAIWRCARKQTLNRLRSRYGDDAGDGVQLVDLGGDAAAADAPRHTFEATDLTTHLFYQTKKTVHFKTNHQPAESSLDMPT
eukprot:gene334-30610_t